MIENDSNNDDATVAGLLALLPRINAPGDFNFKVSARIASRASSPERRFRFAPLVGLAAPAVLALGVGTYWFMSPGIVDVEQPPLPAAPVAQSTAPAAQPTVVASSAAPITLPDQLTTKNVETVSPRSADTVSPRTARENSLGGGSFDSAATASRRVLPRGINPDSRPITRKPRDMQNPAGIPAQDILTSLGADVEYAVGGYTVGTIRSASVAERVGLKSGDVVEAINDQKVVKETSFNGAFSGRTIRVKREGKTLDIDLTKP
ncbi:MAG: hypothetical protein H0X08_01255 [Blastocatellia bacterium]|nr:hypothetical protein [Blastocatellia bacterium]